MDSMNHRQVLDNGMRKPSRSFANKALAALACCLMASCSLFAVWKTPVFLIDEAFTLIQSDITDRIVEKASRKSASAGSFKALSLEAIEASVLAEIQKQQGQKAAAIVASPLAARMIAEEVKEPEIQKKINVIALFPDLYTRNANWIHGIAYDYTGAYATMAKQALKALAAVARKNQSASAIAIVFQENFMRPPAALETFVETASKALGREKIRIEALWAADSPVDISGSIGQAIDRVSTPDVGVIILAIDEAYVARSRSLSDTTRTYFSDETGWRSQGFSLSRSNFRYRILGNERKIVTRVMEVLGKIAGGTSPGSIRPVSLRSSRFPVGIF